VISDHILNFGGFGALFERDNPIIAPPVATELCKDSLVVHVIKFIQIAGF